MIKVPLTVRGAEMLKAELLVRRPTDTERLNGSGLFVTNVPYRMDVSLSTVLTTLAERLSALPDTGGSADVEWL